MFAGRRFSKSSAYWATAALVLVGACVTTGCDTNRSYHHDDDDDSSFSFDLFGGFVEDAYPVYAYEPAFVDVEYVDGFGYDEPVYFDDVYYDDGNYDDGHYYDDYRVKTADPSPRG